MNDTPHPETPADPGSPDVSADAVPTEATPVAAVPVADPPPEAAPAAGSPTPPVPPAGTPTTGGVPPVPPEQPTSGLRSTGRKVAVAVGGLVAAGLIFGAGIATGYVGAHLDDGGRFDRVVDRMERRMGDHDDDDRFDRDERMRDRFGDSQFPGGGRSDRDGDGSGRSGNGNSGGGNGLPGRGMMPGGPSGGSTDGAVPVPGTGGGFGDQPIIVYPDGRRVPLDQSQGSTGATTAPVTPPTSVAGA